MSFETSLNAMSPSTTSPQSVNTSNAPVSVSASAVSSGSLSNNASHSNSTPTSSNPQPLHDGTPPGVTSQPGSPARSSAESSYDSYEPSSRIDHLFTNSSVLVYSDNLRSPEERRAQQRRYAFDEEALRDQVEELDQDIDVRIQMLRR